MAQWILLVFYVEGAGSTSRVVIFRFCHQNQKFFCKNILHKKIRMAKFFRAKISTKNGVNRYFKFYRYGPQAVKFKIAFYTIFCWNFNTKKFCPSYFFIKNIFAKKFFDFDDKIEK